MTSTITQVTALTVTSTGYAAFSLTIGAVAVVLMIGMLVLRETMRVAHGDESASWVNSLNLAIAPLMIAFGVIMALRLKDCCIPGSLF